MSAVTVPELWCPIPFTEPQADHLLLARGQLASWLESFPLGERYLQAGGVELAAFTTPGPADVEALVLTAQFHTWLFATDDTYCDEARDGDPGPYLALLPKLLAVLDPPFVPAVSDEPFVAALVNLRDRVIGYASARRVRRFADTMREALLSLAWELPVRAGMVPLDSGTYRALRRRNGAVLPCIELSGLISAVDPEDLLLDDIGVRKATALAVDHIGIANDLWSYAKETASPERVPTLLPHVLMTERGVGLTEAVAATGALCDELMSEFEAACHVIEEAHLPGAIGYMNVLRAWVRGNLEWSARCRRYHPGGSSR
ncbi:terpene synthase family protein [Streptomyces sp. NPDC001635]|nr:hypothetical protein E4K10_46455 [Streptomyces sp. T1317-0309]